ncbi:MAG: RsmB/NOP family class I SAM-dependent RNA methyltransferase [Paracoccaceae bacterium]
MTPPARISAAIEILDAILAGAAGEKVLTNWARANRYAGSGDRAAIRDLVFAAQRCRRSYGWTGGAMTGRGLMIGHVLTSEMDASTLFCSDRFAPAPLSEAELTGCDISKATRGVRLDCPDWLLANFDGAAGENADTVLQALQKRAPVFLRVNTGKTDLAGAALALAADGITTAPNARARGALEVRSNPRRVAQSRAFKDGLVELQDAGSQAVVAFLDLQGGQNVLDYCAGGGGKSLAMAAAANINVTAYDIDNKRMKDLKRRAVRAGADIQITDAAMLSGRRFDLVLVDAPCSGSGAWRRSPDAKWNLTPKRLQELVALQVEVLDQAAAHVREGGTLAYATCSLFLQENSDQVARFLGRWPGWKLLRDQQSWPDHSGDGFYIALLTRVGRKS